MKASKIMVVVPILLAMTVLGFQNCSEVEFGSTGGSNKPAGDGGGGGLDVGGEEPPADDGDVTTPPTDDPEDPTDDVDPRNRMNCRVDVIKDVILNIKEFSIAGKSVDGVVGLRSLTQLSQATVVITREQAMSNQVRLVLHDINNQVVDMNDDHFHLKTPSAQQSGVKILLNKTGVRNFNAGTGYRIQFDLDLEDQVVRTGSGKCILKPVLHATVVDSFEF